MRSLKQIVWVVFATFWLISLGHSQSSTEKDGPGNYAISLKMKAEVLHAIWMEKQKRDDDLRLEGKVLVSGIFQDRAKETITILQPMLRSEAETIMKNDPLLKAGLCTASLRRFSCYAPQVAFTLPKVSIQPDK